MVLEYSTTKCEVCQNDSHGVHFGVETCRACAAFFRRSEHRKEEYVCRDFCEFSKKSIHCKACRLKKCEQVGMVRKSIGESLKLRKSPVMEVMQYQERVAYTVWHPQSQKPVKWVDINPIIRRSHQILRNFFPPTNSDFESLNPLQKMEFSLSKIRSTQRKTVKFEKFMIFDEYFLTWEEHMTRAAEWLMHSQEFRELPEHEKLEFFKIIWAVWRRVERNSMTARIFGQKTIDEKILIISDDSATKLGEFRLDVSEICNHGFEKYNGMMRKNLHQYIDIVVRPCIDWNFTDIEISFAISQIVWNYAGRKLLGQTQAAGEIFLEKISNNLHDYYQFTLKMSNYAPRLAVLMEMVNNVLKVQMEHEKTMEMAFLFDMFTVVVSEPKFFSV